MSRPMLLLALLSAAGLPAQDRAVPVDTGTFLLRAAGGFAAEGRDWHADFAADGTTFTAALGAVAPRTATLRLQLLDHGRGGERVPARVATPRADDAAVHYERGALVERYDVRRDGLELAIRIAGRPAGAGDLSVRFRVDTWLPVAAATATAVRFADAAGGIGIGAVTGIDADGRRVAGRLELDGDVLALVLPSAFVDDARFPLVIDPLIATATMVSSGSVDTEPAAAFEESSLRYLVAWRRTFSATQSLVRAQLLDVAGTPLGALIPLATTAPPAFVCWRPSVAARPGEFYVGWSGAVHAFYVPNAYATRVAVNGAVSGETLLLPQAGYVDLACSPATNLVMYATWQGAGTGGVGNLLWNGTNLVPQPLASGVPTPIALSRGGAPADPFVVAVAANGNLELGDAHGSSPRQVVRVSGVDAIPGAAVAMTDATHGLVVWAELQSPGTSGRCDVYGRAFHFAGVATGVVFDTPAVAIATDPLRDERAPTAVALGGKYGVAWQSADDQGHVDAVYCDLATDCAGCGTVTRMNAPNTLGALPVLVGRSVNGGQPSGDAMLVAVQTGGMLPGGGDLWLRPVTRFVGGPIVEAGPGCGFAGTFDTLGGPAALGNQDFTLRLSNFPAGGLTFVLLGFPGGEATCGLCTFVNPVVAQYVVPTSSTEVRQPLPLPCRAGYLGLPLAAQWLVFGAGSSPCPAAPGLVASRRLQATLGM